MDRRPGRASAKRVPVGRAEELEQLYRSRYSGFTARHCHEHFVRDHGFTWGYTRTRSSLQTNKPFMIDKPLVYRTNGQGYRRALWSGPMNCVATRRARRANWG